MKLPISGKRTYKSWSCMQVFLFMAAMVFLLMIVLYLDDLFNISPHSRGPLKNFVLFVQVFAGLLMAAGIFYAKFTSMMVARLKKADKEARKKASEERLRRQEELISLARKIRPEVADEIKKIGKGMGVKDIEGLVSAGLLKIRVEEIPGKTPDKIAAVAVARMEKDGTINAFS